MGINFPKTLRSAIGALALGSLLAGPIQEASAKPYIYAGLENLWTVGTGTPISTIDGVPEYMRNVPAHLEDGGGEVGAIRDGGFSFAPVGSLDLSLKVGLREPSKFDLVIGGKAGIDSWDYLWQRIGYERNYTNDPGTERRGYGAALTYYDVLDNFYYYGAYARGSIFTTPLTSLFLEYELEVPISPGITVATGWDRFNEREPYKDYKADYSALFHSIKLGAEFYQGGGVFGTKFRFGLFAGVKIPEVESISSLAQEMGLKFSPSFFGGMHFGIELETPEPD